MPASHESPRNRRIYLDHNATTPPSLLLKERWSDLFELWGNPSSIHSNSRPAKLWLRETRQKISSILGCSTLEIIFNSGASEGNNTVLKSVWTQLGQSRPEFLISHIEHPSVMKTAEYLESCGAIIHYIPVSRSGVIDFEFIKKNISSKTALVSVMFANNETGTLFPIAEISELAHAAGALMHSDCVQMFGKSLIDFKTLNLDYATFSGHKFYALKGSGFTFVKKSSPWIPLIHGGGQERSRRGGTENILGIASLGIALDSFVHAEKKVKTLENLRNAMEHNILESIPNISITSFESPRLCNTSSLIINDVDGETLLMSLDLKGFSVSTGAACSSGNPEPSPVLLAIGLTRQEAQNSLRISLGWENTEEEVLVFVQVLKDVVKKLRNINSEFNLKEKKI
ncbi:MAG: cysteine desulfurase family protein [Pseudobdellovibrio sp.]